MYVLDLDFLLAFSHLGYAWLLQILFQNKTGSCLIWQSKSLYDFEHLLFIHTLKLVTLLPEIS